MPNNLESNVSTKVAKVIMDGFQSSQVLTKTVNSTTVSGANGVTNETGDTVYVKRPHQYKSIQTSDGDISGSPKNEISSGRIAATVQNFITVPVEYPNLEEVTELNQLQEILMPAAEELASTFEVSLGKFMINNSGLTYGSPGVAVDSWMDVTGSAALMKSIGVPDSGERYYAMNSFSQASLSNLQAGLTSVDTLVRSAWENAQISGNFGGLRAISSNALSNYTSGASATRTGTLSSAPDSSWVTSKDSMQQVISLTGLTPNITNAVRPGDTIVFDGTGANERSFINIKTRQVAMGIDGKPMPYTMTVVIGGDTNGSGAVTVTATNSAINATDPASSQYQTISAPLASGDAFTILGATDTAYQPNLAYHKNAFLISTLKLPKLHATDTIATTKEGLSMRITKYSEGDKNTQKWRIDMLPVMGVANPMFSCKSFGV